MRHDLEIHFRQALNLPPSATAWLLGLWDAIQILDDVADGDEITRDDLNRGIFQMLVAMPANPFFAANSSALLSSVTSMILKWQASDAAERCGTANEVSYVWRAGYYDVILMVVHLCHGYDRAVELAPVVMSLYGETFDEYSKEFTICQPQ